MGGSVVADGSRPPGGASRHGCVACYSPCLVEQNFILSLDRRVIGQFVRRHLPVSPETHGADPAGHRGRAGDWQLHTRCIDQAPALGCRTHGELPDVGHPPASSSDTTTTSNRGSVARGAGGPRGSRRDPDEPHALPRIHRRLGRIAGAAPPGLYLHEHERESVPSEEIDLAQPGPEICARG